MSAPLPLTQETTAGFGLAARSALQEKRQGQRVNVALPGRILLEDRSEHPCQVVNMPPCGAAALASVSGQVGERVVCYLDTLGRIEGRIERTFASGFAFSVIASHRKKGRFAEQLTWLSNKDALGLEDERSYDRIVPKNSFSQMALPDGRVINCRVINVSMSGLGIQAEEYPVIGSNIVVGKTPCRVVRHFENGIGVEFPRAPSEQLMSEFI